MQIVGQQPEAQRRRAFRAIETETSHWYFWGMARRFAVDNDALTALIREGQGKIFAEALEMLERQQLNLSRNPERRLLKLSIDAGGARARMLIDRTIAGEAMASTRPLDSVEVAL